METKEAVSEYIAKSLREKLDSNTKIYSISYFSHKTGVPFNSIKRIAQGESKSISSFNAFSILAYLEGTPSAVKMMKKSYPDWYKRVGVVHEKRSRKTAPTSEIIWNPVLLGILDQCSMPGNCSDRKIAKHFGEINGYEARNVLLENEVIYETRDGFYETSEFTDSNITSIMAQIGSDTLNFPIKNIGQKAKCARDVYALSDKAAKKWQDKVQRFYSEMNEIVTEDMESNEDKKNLCRLNIFSYYTEEGDK